jgi:hypothetical protein
MEVDFMPNHIYFGSGFISKSVDNNTGVNDMFGPILGKLAKNVNVNDTVYRTLNFKELKIDHSILPPSVNNSNPAGYGVSMEEFNNQVYMATAFYDSPYFYVYRWNTSTNKWERLSSPATTLPGIGRSVSLKTFGGALYMVVTSQSSPYVRAYRYNGSTWTDLSLSANPNNQSYSSDLEIHDGQLYLSVTSISSPFVFSYKLVGTTFTALTAPESTPTSTGRDVDLHSHNGKLYMSVAHSSNPFVTTYYLNQFTELWVRLGDAPQMPLSSTSYAAGTALVSNNNRLYRLVLTDRGPYLFVFYYNENTNLWENIPNDDYELGNYTRGAYNQGAGIDAYESNGTAFILMGFENFTLTDEIMFKLGRTGKPFRVPFSEPKEYGRRGTRHTKIFKASNDSLYLAYAKDTYPYIEVFVAEDRWTNDPTQIDFTNQTAHSIGIAKQSGTTGQTINIVQVTP